MKLQTSFVKSPANLLPVLSVLSWGIALLMLLLTVYLVYSANQHDQKNELQREYQEKLQSKLLVYDRGSARKNNQLTLEQFENLKQRVAQINDLTEFTGKDISLILSELETLTPADTVLVSLSYRSLNDELKLVVEAVEVANLTLFIERMETADLFNDIAIVRQDNVINNGQTSVQFEVHLKNTAKERVN